MFVCLVSFVCGGRVQMCVCVCVCFFVFFFFLFFCFGFFGSTVTKLTVLILCRCYSRYCLTELITPYQSHRSGLRSSTDTSLLTRSKTCLCFSSKGIYASAPKLWNSLPHHIRHASSLSKFKSSLKTHLL